MSCVPRDTRAVDVVVATNEDIERHRDKPYYVIQPALREGRVLYPARSPHARCEASSRTSSSWRGRSAILSTGDSGGPPRRFRRHCLREGYHRCRNVGVSPPGRRSRGAPGRLSPGPAATRSPSPTGVALGVADNTRLHRDEKALASAPVASQSRAPSARRPPRPTPPGGAPPPRSGAARHRVRERDDRRPTRSRTSEPHASSTARPWDTRTPSTAGEARPRRWRRHGTSPGRCCRRRAPGQDHQHRLDRPLQPIDATRQPVDPARVRPRPDRRQHRRNRRCAVDELLHLRHPTTPVRTKPTAPASGSCAWPSATATPAWRRPPSAPSPSAAPAIVASSRSSSTASTRPAPDSPRPPTQFDREITERHSRQLLESLAKTQVLVLDDWGLSPLSAEHRHDLLAPPPRCPGAAGSAPAATPRNLDADEDSPSVHLYSSASSSSIWGCRRSTLLRSRCFCIAFRKRSARSTSL